MLASPFNPQQAPTYHYGQREFLPKIPSPLSPRSANIYGRPGHQPIFMSDDQLSEPQNSSPGSVPYSKRAIKRAPTISQDALKERRRGMFLKKVREGREDKRFEKHGEDIMRLDFVQRQKKWEAEQARSAPLLPCDAPEEEEELDYSLPMSSHNAMQMSVPSSQSHATLEEADEVARRESEELEALLTMLPGEESGLPQHQARQAQSFQHHQNQHVDEQMSEHFGSDDDDYDALFMDFINADAHEPDNGEGHAVQMPASSGDAMDMS